MEVVEIKNGHKRKSKNRFLSGDSVFYYVGVVREEDTASKRDEEANMSGMITNGNMGVKHGRLKKSS